LSSVRWPLALLVVVTVVVVQVEVVDTLRPAGGVRIDLPLLVVLGFGFVARPPAAAALGFATGLVLDLHQLTPLGLTALVFAVAGWSLAVASEQVLDAGPFFRTIQGGMAALSVSALLWVAGSLLEQDPAQGGWPLVGWTVGLAVSGAVGVHPATAVARRLHRHDPLPSQSVIDRHRVV
jgi:rod shape-determining protein MreD